jgi:predicted protein tyrosine phosphatase
MIYVTSYWELDRRLRAKRPSGLVSILGPKDNLPWPDYWSAERHLKLTFDDTERTVGGFGPNIGQIAEMIGFFRRWNLEDSLMIHCHGGISRSPAAALVALSIFNPGRERQAAALLRRQAQHADPNDAVIRLADQALQLGGRLVAAVDSMSVPSGKGGRRFIELSVHVPD